jgi:hypothetical protein
MNEVKDPNFSASCDLYRENETLRTISLNTLCAKSLRQLSHEQPDTPHANV